jgi:hypothetical protein
VLEGGPHAYLDDLESFYYVLCTIAAGYTSPGIQRVPRPTLLKGFDDPYAAIIKEGFIISRRGFELPVSAWFGEPMRTLCVKLHSFFRTRYRAAEDAEVERRTPPRRVAPDDYAEFLKHIRQAILEQEGLDLARRNTVGDPPNVHEGTSSSAYDGSADGSELLLHPPRRRPPRIAPVVRPRRSKAHYKP